MAEDNKPKDWLNNFAERDFADTGSVDVATVPATAKPEDMLFGKDRATTADDEPQDDTFVWDESDAAVKKYGQGMWRTDVIVDSRVQRFFGKTRTEVTKGLIEAQKNATRKIAEQSAKLTTMPTPVAHSMPSNLVPDTKLPYDPISMSASRQLTADEIIQVQELWQTDPARAQRMVFQAMMGCSPEAIGQAISRMDSMFARRIADEAAFQFQADHSDDWDATQANSALIEKFLKDRNWPATRNNFEIAFQTLRSQNALTMPKNDEPPAVAVIDEPPIEEFTPPPPPVSLPAGTSQSRVVKPETDLLREAAAGIRDMPLSDARESLAQAFRRQRGSR